MNAKRAQVETPARLKGRSANSSDAGLTPNGLDTGTLTAVQKFILNASRGLNVKPNDMNKTDYPAMIRCAFVDFVDSLARSGQISETLAGKVTL